MFCQGQVLHDEELVLQPHVFRLLWHLEAVLVLEGVVLVDGLGVEEDPAGDLLAIVANGVEEGLSIGEQGDVDLAGADALVAADYLELLAVIAKRHVVAHQVDLADDRQEGLQRDVELASYADRDHLLLLVDLVLQADPLLLLVELPLALVELGVKLHHVGVLLRDLLDQLLPVLGNLGLFAYLFHVFQRELVGIVDVVLPVGSLDRLPKLIVLIYHKL